MEYYNCIDSERIYNKTLLNKIKDYNLEIYFKLNNGWITSNYVGFIIKDHFIISIYPKHLISKDEFKEEGKLEEFKLLSKLMVQLRVNDGIIDELDRTTNFPLVSYQNICNYYLLHGLYWEMDKIYKYSYGGKINWKQTIEKSDKIISNRNLLYLPFVIEKKNRKKVFLTECMKYILSNGYSLFGRYFDIGVPFYSYENNKMFNDFPRIIKELKIIKQEYFKDLEKKLIDNMICYFEWKNMESDIGLLLTNNFNLYWEKMIESFLNENFDGIVEDSKELNLYKLKLSNNTKKYRFAKVLEKIETDVVYNKKYTRRFKVEYDHIASLNDMIFIFDSKYYKDIKSLDYKQVVYHLILKEKKDYSDKQIINGLILPTSGDYEYKVHLDLRDKSGSLEDILILEHYLNLKEIIISYLDKN